MLLVADVDPAERPDDPDEFYDHQLVGLAVRTVAGVPVGELGEVLHLPGPGRARRPPARRHRGAGAVRRGDRPERRPRRGARSWSTRRPACSPTYRTTTPARRDVRLDVVTIFPEYLAPLRLSLIGRRRRGRPDRPAGARPARLDLRPAPHRRRHAVRRRGRAWSCGPSRGATRSTRSSASRLPSGRRRGCWCPVPAVRRSARRWRTTSRPSPGWSSPAGATRASTSGCSTRPRAAAGSPRSAWATTCSTAARWRCWRSSRRWPGCCPG